MAHNVALRTRAKEGKGALLAAAALACAAVCGLFAAPAPAFAAQADTSWYTDHAADAAYRISDANDLAGLAQLVNEGTTDFSGKTIVFEPKLPGSSPMLSLSGEFEPIGTADHPFNGIFDGKGLVVRGLSITQGSCGVGFFGVAGAASEIRNLSVAGSIDLVVPEGSTDVLTGIGGVVGDTAGSLSNCTSSVSVSVQSSVAATKDDPQTINYVGGVAGRAKGDMANCRMLSLGSVFAESREGALDEVETWIIGYVGGVAGMHGPDPFSGNIADIANVTTIESCENAAPVRVHTYVPGPIDRFGNPTNTASQFLGGIVGYTSGSVRNCTNTGLVDSAERGADGAILPAIGATSAGGIAGAMRIDRRIVSAGDESDPGLAYNKETGEELWIELSGCENTGDVVGLSQVGGIVGQAGTYTHVRACGNEGDVEATRYTKPCPAGVAGRTYGYVSYCYNTGDVASTTGAGYYAAGVIGMMNSIGKDKAGDYIMPEAWACYNSGYVLTSSPLYRSGSIVGAFDNGYIHDCFSLSNRVETDRLVGEEKYNGTLAESVVEIPEAQFTAAESLARLNACADKDGWGVYFALPEGKQFGDRDAHFILRTASYASASDLGAVVGASVETALDAPYSASIDPVPSVTVRIGGQTLVQNVDFRVIPAAGTAGAPVSDARYEASIVGIGRYVGTLPETATYRIRKGPIDSCTIVAEPVYFNFEKQKPEVVHVYDSSGTELAPSEYAWDVDQEKWAQTDRDGELVPYLDAQSIGQKNYPITITATDQGNYEGSKTSDAFTIKTVQFAYSGSSQNPFQNTLLIGDVKWGDQTWAFSDVSSYETNSATGDSSKRGAMKVKYTGSPIKPTIEGITYRGRPLVEIEEGDLGWAENPKAYGYKLLYGNPNPELGTEGQMESADELVTNVTGDDYAVFTIRAAVYSNFDNFVTVWFEILPASIETDAVMSGFKDVVEYRGCAATQDDVSFTYNGMTLVKGKDYTVVYEPQAGTNQMRVTYRGIGNYTGTITKTYETTGAPDAFTDVVETDWYQAEGGYVDFVSRNRIMEGKTGVAVPTFGIGENLTRGQVAVILYRLATGQTAESTDNNVQTSFADVHPGDYYAAAVGWAADNKIVTGDTDGEGNPVFTFRPNDNVKRQDLQLMIYRFANYYGIDTSVDVASVLAPYAQSDRPDPYAETAVAWCVDRKIVSGSLQPDGTRILDPYGTALREQMAKITTVVWRDVLVVETAAKNEDQPTLA